MFVVTGATGQLGRMVVDKLLETIPASRIVALARDAAKAADMAQRGVVVRTADYDQPETVRAALQGAERVLLISSSAVGRRVPQHLAVIKAAKQAGVQLIAYTSVLHADRSPLGLAGEHRETEQALAASGLDAVILRNGWYSENYASMIRPAIEHGALLGAAGDGLISSASRADYAAAAAAVLSASDPRIATYELAGDTAWTKAEFAGEIASQSGRPVSYRDMPAEAFTAALTAIGLPDYVVRIVVDADTCAGQGALHDDSRTLSKLIGRSTTPISSTIAATL